MVKIVIMKAYIRPIVIMKASDWSILVRKEASDLSIVIMEASDWLMLCTHLTAEP